MRRSVAALALGIVIGACSGGTADPPPAAAPVTDPPPTEATEAAAPTTGAPTTSTSLGFETPLAIDVPYVQRVLDEIYRLQGEAARYIYAKRLPDAEFNARLEAIFGDPALEDAKTLFGRGAARSFDTFADPPGDPKVKVRDVIEATAACILVTATLDFRPLFKSATLTEPDGVVILSSADVLPLNPTGWGVVSAGRPTPGRKLKAC